jgi:hypothetical protein
MGRTLAVEKQGTEGFNFFLGASQDSCEGDDSISDCFTVQEPRGEVDIGNDSEG